MLYEKSMIKLFFVIQGMEIFQKKIVYLPPNSPLADVCNDIRLNGTDFAK